MPGGPVQGKIILLRGFQPLEPAHILMRPSPGYDFFDPSSGMRGFEVQNLLETLLANRASFDDGSAGENAQMHPYQGCLGSRCKTS